MKPAVKIVRCAGGSYRGWCPALPGCAVCAETREEVLSRIRHAVAGYLASMDVPMPTGPGRNWVAEETTADAPSAA
jgi:predicted RNase H-like HicB family nuclease